MSREPKTLICFAVPQESKPLVRRLPSQPDLRVLVTGMGPENARRELQRELALFQPDRVFTCGFAGGLHPEYRRNEVFFETTSPQLAALLQAAGARAARFLCTDRIATTREEKRALRTREGGELVEMESGVIQSICSTSRIPCATVRVVSDEAGEDLPLDFNQLMTPSYRLSGIRLLAALLRRPNRIPALIRLGQASARAANSLADVLERTLTPPARA